MKGIKDLVMMTVKEFKGYFVSPIAYSVMTVFAVIGGTYFFIVVDNFYKRLNEYQVYAQIQQNPEILERINLNDMVIAPVFQFLIIVMIFVVPAISMRLIADERRMKTDELLLTSPIGLYSVIIGKFLGAMMFLAVLLSTSLLYIGVLFHYSSPEIGPVISGYIGLLLVGGLLLSIGLFASSFTSNQINSYFIAFAIGLLLLVVGWAGQISTSKMGQILTYISITDHYKDFVKGVIDTGSIIYYVTATALFLFLSKQSVESIRWR